MFKITKAYKDKKYLLLINYIERLSSINSVLSITGRDDNQVYEDFELFLEISAICLSNKDIPPLNWELPVQEGQRLSGFTNIAEIAKFFANNIHIYGDRLLLSTNLHVQTNHPNVLSMNEKVIRTLQSKFRTRKFTNNFTKFRDNLDKNRYRIITRAVMSRNNVSYHVLGYERDANSLEVEVWDLINYEKHNLIINKKIIEKLYAKDNKTSFDYIFKFLAFEIKSNKEYGLVLKEQNLADYLAKHKQN